jgi:hypothetical protein
MAENENMAIRFYETGNPNDLADHLVSILQSPKLEQEMAQQNFAAGLDMTMSHVAANYLRWFELNQCKKRLRNIRGLFRPRITLTEAPERSSL